MDRELYTILQQYLSYVMADPEMVLERILLETDSRAMMQLSRMMTMTIMNHQMMETIRAVIMMNMLLKITEFAPTPSTNMGMEKDIGKEMERGTIRNK